MLNAAVILLKEKELLDYASFGGGTVLSAFYWKHRFSTDIDIFLYTEKNIINNLRESQWNNDTKEAFRELGYINGNMQNHPVYLEFFINEEMKVQFLDSMKRTSNPYSTQTIFGQTLNVESVNEIIAKKIFFRGSVGNSRDIFDIAVALNKNPLIFDEMDLPVDKIKAFHDKVMEINNDTNKLEVYRYEISEMNPANNYKILAKHSLYYLECFLNDYISSIEMQDKLNIEELQELEALIYDEIIELEMYLEFYEKINDFQSIPSSEFSKVDFESEAFKSLPVEKQETITNYINTE